MQQPTDQEFGGQIDGAAFLRLLGFGRETGQKRRAQRIAPIDRTGFRRRFMRLLPKQTRHLLPEFFHIVSSCVSNWLYLFRGIAFYAKIRYTVCKRRDKEEAY